MAGKKNGSAKLDPCKEKGNKKKKFGTCSLMDRSWPLQFFTFTFQTLDPTTF